MWMALTATVPPRRQPRERERDELAGGRERHRRVERRRRGARPPTPGPDRSHASRASSRWRCLAREGVHLAAPVPRDLDGEVGRGPEAEEAEPSARRDSGEPQRAVADDARRRAEGPLRVAGNARRQRIRPARVGGEALRVAAVAVPTGESSRRGRGSRGPRRRTRSGRTSRPSSRRRRDRRREKPFTPAPTATIGPRGLVARARSEAAPDTSPSRMWRSVRQTPHASTAICDFPGAAATAAISSRARTSGPPRPGPVRSSRMARIDAILSRETIDRRRCGASTRCSRTTARATRCAGTSLCHAAGITLIVFGLLSFLARVPIAGVWTASELLVVLAFVFYAALDFPLALAVLALRRRPRRRSARRGQLAARAWRPSPRAGCSRESGTRSTRRIGPAFLRNLVHLLIGPAYLVDEALGPVGAGDRRRQQNVVMTASG